MMDIILSQEISYDALSSTSNALFSIVSCFPVSMFSVLIKILLKSIKLCAVFQGLICTLFRRGVHISMDYFTLNLLNNYCLSCKSYGLRGVDPLFRPTSNTPMQYFKLVGHMTRYFELDFNSFKFIKYRS